MAKCNLHVVVRTTFLINPLTPVPAETGRVENHPQIPVPAKTGHKQGMCIKALSLPPWVIFVSPIVLLF